MSRRVARVVFAVVAFGGLVWATVSQWSRVADTLGSLSIASLVLGAVAMAAGTFCSFPAWRAILADLGSPLPARSAFGIFFLAQLGKYIPGSLWPVLAQMELGKAHGVPRKRSGVALLLTMAMGLTAAGLVAAATLPFVASLSAYRWVLVVPAVGLVVLHPAVFRWVTTRALRLVGRGPLEGSLSGRGVAVALAWSIAQWLGYGAAVWLVARELPGSPDGLFLLATGAYALAWSAGFLFVVAPAGAGVREGGIVLLLTPSFGAGPALGIALVARLLATVGDLVWGVGAVVTRGTRGQDVPESGRQ